MEHLPTQHWIYRSVIIILILALSGWLLVEYLERSYASSERYVSTQITDTVAHIERATSENLLSTDERPVIPWVFSRCSSDERNTFEDTLARLGTGLSATALRELEVWFDRCGTVIAQRRAYTAQEITVAVDHLEQLLAIYETLPTALRQPKISLTYDDVPVWQSYAQAWQEYAAQQFVLDEVQRALIQARIAGSAVDGSVILSLLETVEEEREKLDDRRSSVRALEADISL